MPATQTAAATKSPAPKTNGTTPPAASTISTEIYHPFLAISLIHTGQQPRKHFDIVTMAELMKSIKAKGVLQPVIVRPYPGGGFELVAGERRLRASIAAELDTIPATERNLTDAEVLEIQIIENAQRALQAAAAKATAKADMDDRVRSEAYLAVRAQLAKGLSEPDWRLLATILLNALIDTGDSLDMIASLYLPPNTDYTNWEKLRSGLHKAIAALPMAELPRFIFDCAHEPIVDSTYGTNDDFKALDTLFTRHGVDQKAIRARLVKEDKAKAATAAAIKAPTAPASKGAKK